MTRSNTGMHTTVREGGWARAPQAVAACWWRFLLTVLLGLSATAHAADIPAPVDARNPPQQALGQHMRLLVESGARLSLTEAKTAFDQEPLPSVTTPVLGLGLGHRPVWVHFVIDNPTRQPLTRLLAVEPSWTDTLELHLLGPTGETLRWQTGDAMPGAAQLDSSLGYVFEHSFAPGRSEVLLRLATPDPLIVKVQLFTDADAVQHARFEDASYGFLYGFLAALAMLNLSMYFGLGRRNSLYYALYLLSFIAMNLGYTGRGLAWLWPELPYFQRHVVLVLMVLSACAGLKFAREFLQLDQLTPKLGSAIRWTCRLMIAWILLMAVLDWHTPAVWSAFFMSAAFSVALVPIGAAALRRGQTAAGYFLASGVAATIGLVATTFSVWGLLPFNDWTYRGVEMGTMAEALLLQLALVQFIRVQIHRRADAERDARVDPLTQLSNRRGFLEQAETAFQLAQRHQRPLSIAILDIDLFKHINDRHGHAMGDEVLVQVGQTLTHLTRSSDCVARWGGEEFIMLLPETDLATATDFAERIRRALEVMEIPARDGVTIRITASFGVAQLQPGQALEKLIIAADDALYSVKHSGRNRVAQAAPA